MSIDLILNLLQELNQNTLFFNEFNKLSNELARI